MDDENFEFFVFDRWGEVIFTADTYTAAWDGTVLNGAPAKLDVYAWRVLTRNSITGERLEFKGHVTLLR